MKFFFSNSSHKPKNQNYYTQKLCLDSDNLNSIDLCSQFSFLLSSFHNFYLQLQIWNKNIKFVFFELVSIWVLYTLCVIISLLSYECFFLCESSSRSKWCYSKIKKNAQYRFFQLVIIIITFYFNFGKQTFTWHIEMLFIQKS